MGTIIALGCGAIAGYLFHKGIAKLAWIAILVAAPILGTLQSSGDKSFFSLLGLLPMVVAGGTAALVYWVLERNMSRPSR